MKVQIRRGVFETNSSSTHSLCIVSEDQFERWKNGELYFDKYNNEFKTKEELIDWARYSDCWYKDKVVGMTDDEVLEFIHENDDDWRTYENYESDYLEYFETHFSTPQFGEKMVAFGEYGYNG